MQQNSAQTGPIVQYPLRQPRQIQWWFRTHCSEPRITDKPAPAGLSPLRLRDFGRAKSGQTGPIAKQANEPEPVQQEEARHPITDKMETVNLGDFTRWDTVEMLSLAEMGLTEPEDAANEKLEERNRRPSLRPWGLENLDDWKWEKEQEPTQPPADWLTADVPGPDELPENTRLSLIANPPIEDECETQAREDPALYQIQLLARRRQRERKGH